MCTDGGDFLLCSDMDAGIRCHCSSHGILNVAVTAVTSCPVSSSLLSGVGFKLKAKTKSTFELLIIVLHLLRGDSVLYHLTFR